MLYLTNWLRRLCVGLLLAICTFACAQEREEDQDAAKRAPKAERKTRKEKKAEKSGVMKLPPAPETPEEFEFFDGAIFSRKVDLGLKNVLCFASERRPLAMLWCEMGRADASREGGTNFPARLSPQDLQRIFSRPVAAAQISVLNASGQMLSRGTPTAVEFNLGRQPVYLLVEITPSRPRAVVKN